MARREVIVSDLTGKVLDEAERAELRVMQHPLIDRPVRLDAATAEVAGLRRAAREFVTVEVAAGGEEPERLIVDLGTFDALFTGDVPVDDVLASAEPTRQPRRTRAQPTPSKVPADAGEAVTPRRDTEQLRAIRDWARDNGWPDLGERDRIPQAAVDAYTAAQQSPPG